MNRFLATLSWRGAALVGALVLAAGLAGPVSAANTNLTATAKYSSSSDWESDQGNTTFVAAKAFDGDLSTRWNVASGDNDGSWIAAEWDSPVTINKVVVYERFGRIAAYSVQKKDAGKDWETVYEAHDEKFAAALKSGGPGSDMTFQVRFAQPFTTQGLRILFDVTNAPPSIAEVEAYNNPSGTVTGTVTGPDGKGIEGATVRAGGESTTTDAAGKYTLTADAGRHNVTAGKPGAFRDRVARAVELPANGSATQDFSLLPQPPNLARTATAVSYSDWQGGTDYDAAKANDGNLSTRWNSEAGDAEGAYLEMQWPTAQTFNKITVREFDDRIRNYSLQRYDKANDAYVDIVTADVLKRGGDQILTHILPTPVTSERLRLLVNTSDSTSISIYEMEVSNAPVATTKVVVKDAASGNPVPKATIISDLGGVLGITNDQGALDLLVEPDDYVLSASAPGYFTGAPVAFTINAGETKDVALTAPATGPNLARTGKAVASSGVDSASAANDGDLETFWTAEEYANQWVGVTFDKPTHLTVVQLRGFQGTIQRSYLEVLDADGKTWKEVPGTSFAPQFLAGRPADFFLPAGITTTGVRYFITATHSTADIPGLAEIIIHDSPIPNP